jgi:hypothetical protein
MAKAKAESTVFTVPIDTCVLVGGDGSFASANLKGSKSYRGIKGLAEPPVLWKLPLSGTPHMACPAVG